VAKEAGQVRTEELDAEAEVRRRLALSQIRQYPDPALRMEARPVETFDDELAQLAARLSTLMVEANGVGLAATQIGILRRVAVIQHDDDVVVLVNPSITERSEELSSDDEGCLSLQGVLVPVERNCRVTVEARDPTGAEVRLELEGLPARVAQHELDHLDGVLILDRTTEDARREALGTLRPQPVLTLS
jgi:peptide deformylase